MPNIFGGNTGRVIAIESLDTNYMPLGLIVSDFKTQLGVKGILTGLSVTGQSGFQVMHTLRQYLHIYTFGERAGDLSISGLVFTRDCTEDITTGLARLYDWYELNRISHRGAPITIALTPGFVVQGFLTGFRYQMEDPSISLGQFNLQLFYPPRIRPRNAQYTFAPGSVSGHNKVVGDFTKLGLQPAQVGGVDLIVP